MSEEDIEPILAELEGRNLIYRRPHRNDYSLWSNSSVDLSRWLDDAKANIRFPERLEGIAPVQTLARPAVAHRHYHATGTLRTFDVLLWTGERVQRRTADGLILIVPVYPGEEARKALLNASGCIDSDPLVLLCARAVATADLKWAYELALWNWIRENCRELTLDDLARAEVDEHIANAEQALIVATALLASGSGMRPETWWYAGKQVAIPRRGLSALLSDICDQVYDQAPTLKNELIKPGQGFVRDCERSESTLRPNAQQLD